MRKLLCLIGIHKWRIHQLANERGKLIIFGRSCDCCHLDESLQPTKHYSAGAYVWEKRIKTPKP